MTALDPVKLALRTERLRAAMKRPDVRAKLVAAAKARDPATRNLTPLPPMTPEQRRTYKHLQPMIGREPALVALLLEPHSDD